MATKRRMNIADTPVGPSFLPGLQIFANTVTAGNGEAHTVVFPAKTVLAVITQSALDTDADKVVYTSSISGSTATVSFTKTGAGAFSYIIIASVTETIAAQVVASAEVLTPIP